MSKKPTQAEILYEVAAQKGWLFTGEAADAFGVTSIPYMKADGKPGKKTIGEGELSLTIHCGLSQDCLQGQKQPFDIRTPYGDGEGKKEVNLGIQPNATGRRAKSLFETEMATRLCGIHGEEYTLTHILPVYYSRESITRDFLVRNIEPYLPIVTSILNVHASPSAVFKHADFVAMFFNRKLKKISVKGYILVPSSEYDEAFEFENFTRGSATFRLRLDWLRRLI